MATELVVGSTRRDLIVTLTDETGAALNLVGALEVKLQGTSLELPTKTINTTMVFVGNGSDGKVKKAQVGNLVTHTDLGAVTRATFTFRVYFKDISGLVDYSPTFELTYVHPPVDPT